MKQIYLFATILGLVSMLLQVIASDLRSGDWSSVLEASQTFIQNKIIN